MATSTAFSVIPIYTAEIVDPSIRGVVSGLLILSWNAGSLFSFCVGPYTSYELYTALSIIPCFISFVPLLFFPESPYWLIKRGRVQEAKNNLSWFRAKPDVTKEFESIQQAVEEEINIKTQNPLKTLFTDKYERKSFIIIQIISIAKFLTGGTTITTFSTETFSKSANFISPPIMSILLIILGTIFTILSAGLSDRVGRKKLLLISCFGSFIFHFISGLYYFLLEKTDVDTDGYLWMMYVGIIGYTFFFNIGISSLFNTIKAELFGAQTREIATGLTETICTLLSFIAMSTFEVVNVRFGVYFNFWIYAVVSMLAGIILLIFMFETSGKPIGRMQENDTKAKGIS